MTFQLTIPGIPKPQGRPRAFKAGDKIRMFDPDTSRDWKRTVTFMVAQEVQKRGMSPVEGAVWIELFFEMPRPKSLPKRVLYHTKRPDCDNLGKSILDAIKGVLYRDDSQITSIRIAKGYGEHPGVQIFMTEARS